MILPFLGIGITSTSVTAINVFDEIIALPGYSDLGRIVMFFVGILGVFYLRNLNREVEY